MLHRRNDPRQMMMNRPNPLTTVKNKNLIFVSAQPDTVYFHWQVEVYMYQFSKFGIIDNCHVLFGYSGDSPSEGGLKLQKMYKNIHFYKDERVDKTYIPTIRPHILAKFFNEYPYLGKNVFYHDSDILFVRLPNFTLLLNDNISYLSDTVSYIGYNYIIECGKRYREKHPQLTETDLLLGMCKEADINPDLVKANQPNSGGAQYLLKNINGAFWENCEKTCVTLYKYMCDYEKKYPIDHHVQKWTADMWAVLWNYWKMGGATKLHSELDFSWATDTMKDYNSKTIFHLAGVSGDTAKDRFYKAQYTGRNLIDEYIKDNTIFNNVINTSATYGYTRVVIECSKQRDRLKEKTIDIDTPPVDKETQLVDNSETLDKSSKRLDASRHLDDMFGDRFGGRFRHPFMNRSMNRKKFIQKLVINSTNPAANTYIQDNTVTCCGRSIWRSIDDKLIIFFTGSAWVVTYSKYQDDIGPNSGGIVCNLSTDLFVNKWNFDCHVEIVKEEVQE
jgi:hypothetical protein